MWVVCTLHWYYSEEHLSHVRELMRTIGPPVLRGYLDPVSGAVLLREGTHRIRAAHELGVIPVIRPIPWWRRRKALIRARHAAAERGLEFPRLDWAEGAVRHESHTIRLDNRKSPLPTCTICAIRPPWASHKT